MPVCQINHYKYIRALQWKTTGWTNIIDRPQKTGTIGPVLPKKVITKYLP